MIKRDLVDKRMSRIVIHGDTVYFAGIVSDDKTLDITGQSKRVLEMAEERFALAGITKHDILRAEVFVKDIYSDFKAFNVIWDEWVSKDTPPARACVEANMASPTTLLEIIFTASKA